MIKTGLKLYKILIFLNSAYQYLWSIICFFVLKINATSSFPTLKSKVFICGTGQSVDNFDFKKVKNSSVILLNNAWQFHTKFDNSNQIFLFCGDTPGFLKDSLVSVTKNLPKIIVPTSLNFNLDLIKKFFSLRKNLDYLYSIKFNIFFPNPFKKKTLKHNQDLYGFFYPKYTNLKKLSNKIWYGPHTCIFGAIIFAYKTGAKEIYCIGFDATYYKRNINNYSSKLDLHVYEKKFERTRHIIKMNTNDENQYLIRLNLWSSKIYKYLKKNNVNLYNASNISLITKIPHKNIFNISDT